LNNVGISGTYNSAFGYNALAMITSGSNNNAFGQSAMTNNSSGSDNVAIGSNSSASFKGSRAVAVGTGASQYNVNEGYCNSVAVGHEALRGVLNCNNYQNTAVGAYALSATTSGSYNTAIGINALSGNTNGSYNTAIGYNTSNGSGGGSQYSTAIGSGATITASHQIMMGTSSETVVVPGKLLTQNSHTNDLTTLTYTNGTSDTQGRYKVITYQGNGTLILPANTCIGVYVIGGGGGGGGGRVNTVSIGFGNTNTTTYGGDGGGGGGITYSSLTTLSAETYTIIVGAGGTGATENVDASNGLPSSIVGGNTNIIASGGTYGASGGTYGNGGYGTMMHGKNGGFGGINGSSGQQGGTNQQIMTGYYGSGYYGSGGGGGSYGAVVAYGGTNAGNGGYTYGNTTQAPSAATDNRGGGGGGGGEGIVGGNGGNGIVVIFIPTYTIEHKITTIPRTFTPLSTSNFGDGIICYGDNTAEGGGNMMGLVIAPDGMTGGLRLDNIGNVAVAGTLNIGTTKNVSGLQFGIASSSSSGGTVQVYFPYAFITTPVVTCTVVYGGVGYASVSAMIESTTTTYFNYNVLFVSNTHSEQYCQVNWIAIC
jgi:hypothetical protein